jgi:hypothetical protein
VTGGPPVRGDLLPLWSPPSSLPDDQREAWKSAGQSIALGVELVAHLEPILDLGDLRVGFCCDSEELAGIFAERIRAENVQAEQRRAHPGGIAQIHACDVVLPCAPDFNREQIDHVVLASVKASHGIMCPRLISRNYVPATPS